MQIEFKLEHDGERINAMTIADALTDRLSFYQLRALTCILHSLDELHRYEMGVHKYEVEDAE